MNSSSHSSAESDSSSHSSSEALSLASFESESGGISDHQVHPFMYEPVLASASTLLKETVILMKVSHLGF